MLTSICDLKTMGTGEKKFPCLSGPFYFYFLMSQMSVPMAKWPTFFSDVPQAAQQKHSACRGRPKETVEFISKKEFLKESGAKSSGTSI